jgi:hypothetical protein
MNNVIIKQKYQIFIFVFLVATPLTFTMSFFNNLIAKGLSSSFLFDWMKSWGISFLIAYPTALLVATLAKKIIAKIKWV